MAVPQVTNIYPNTAHVGGEAMVRILGGDFRTRYRLSADFGLDGEFVTIIEGPLATADNDSPTVRVSFGAAASQRVVVVNHALMYVLVPTTALDGAGTVDVTVENLDDDGVPIPGESVTKTLAFTYLQTSFTQDSTLVRVVRKFIRELRRQVLRNTTIANTHTDYDAATGDTFNLTELQELPSLVIIGPELDKYTQPDIMIYTDSFGVKTQQRQPLYADLSFQLVGAADRHVVLLNLQSALVTFIQRNPFLIVDRDPDDPAAGQLKFELVFPSSGGAPSINGGGDDNNVSTFGARVVIKDVPITGLPGFNQEGVGGVDVTAPVTEIVSAILLNVLKL